MRVHRLQTSKLKNRHRGASTLDFVLVLGVILPMVAFIIPTGTRIIQMVYEMIIVMVVWPFM